MSDCERAAKRHKRSAPQLSTDMTSSAAPGMMVEICADGDVVLVVHGMAGVPKPVGIQVSSTALTITSSVFRRLLATAPESAAPPTPSPGAEEPRLVPLDEHDGDALLLLLHILHLRNDALPARLRPDLLFRFVATCARYDCLVAAGRAASQWLDYIYTKSLKTAQLSSSTPFPSTPASAVTPTTPASAFPPLNDSHTLFKLIEVSLILNDALYFARFTSHFILTQPLISSISALAPAAPQQRLATTLQARQTQALQDLRIDLDLLVDPLAEALSEDTRHYRDCVPGDDPPQHQLPSSSSNNQDDDAGLPLCLIDRHTATDFLSSLRDANLWPATRWSALLSSSSSSSSPSSTIGAVVSTLKLYLPPPLGHDSSDACYWCMHVPDRFATSLHLVRAMHADRLWGLCLDCYNAGGTNAGECRYEHFKAGGVKGLQGGVQLNGAAAGQGLGGGQATGGNQVTGASQGTGGGNAGGSGTSVVASANSTQS